jgi:hypothetical protein
MGFAFSDGAMDQNERLGLRLNGLGITGGRISVLHMGQGIKGQGKGKSWFAVVFYGNTCWDADDLHVDGKV